MSKLVVAMSYLLGHVAAGIACVTIVVIVPLTLMFAVAILSGDPGGPLFFPLFFLLLVASGVTAAVVLSLLTAGFDLLQMRWKLPFWLPPTLVAFSVSVLADWSAISQALPWLHPLCVIFAAAVFTLYRAAVSSVWFLPRLLSRILSERLRFPHPSQLPTCSLDSSHPSEVGNSQPML